MNAFAQPIFDVNLRWLLRLRWIAYLGALLLVASLPQVARLEFNQGLAMVIIGLGLASNAAASLTRKRVSARRLAAMLTSADLALLTALLSATGGPASPLVLGYVLVLVVASVIVSRRVLWVMCAFAGVALLVTVFAHSALEPDHSHSGTEVDHHPGHISPAPDEHVWLHMRQLWLATLVLIVFVVYVVRWAFEQRESELQALRLEVDKSARLAELWTLAASAAHELGTPLATISVIATELRRRVRQGDWLRQKDWGERAEEDLAVICEQLTRCRTVLDHMANDARTTGREPNMEMTLEAFVREALEASAEPQRIELRLSTAHASSRARIPRRLLLSVVQNLLDNALAAAPLHRASVHAYSDDHTWSVDVADAGPGLSTSDLKRIGRETFSTKPKGMGVGLFLGRAILERLGGSLQLSSGEGGTTVRLTIPRFAEQRAVA